MGCTVCVGAQWGDEGKGKITDWLAAHADYVVRFQGGNNAGHTLVIDGVQTVLHIVPSGVLREGTCAVVGNGCVIDPEVLLQEIELLTARGATGLDKRLLISDGAHVILPFHKRVDKAREHAAGSGRIGTTGRGIGPTYEDKAARRGMRMVDLVDDQRAAKMVRAGVMYANSILDALGAEMYRGAELEDMIARIKGHAARLRPFVGDATTRLHEAVENGERVLLEGAQGAMLDLDHGTYPYVTSSNTLAGHAAVGTGLGPRDIDHVILVAKAYTTRVGEGPFPTEIKGPLGERIRDRGGEYGATTGRERRCGWLDLVQLKYAKRLNSGTHLALTKLDVLAGFDHIKVCTAYKVGETELSVPPRAPEAYADIEPVYEELPGFEAWEGSPQSVDELPEGARNLIAYISDALGIPVAMISTGPGRDQTIQVDNPLNP